MFINHLYLKNYRNYNELELSFDQQINIFQGNNAQGKTNILEALYMLSLTKSHRTSKEKELVQWDQSFSVIKGSISTRRGKLNVEIQLSSKGKKAKINHLEQRKLSDYIGIFNVVMFAPEDLTLVKGNPQYRRRFLDIEIGQVSPTYIYHLSQYHKIVKQRNNLLKDFTQEKKNKIDLLEIWDSQLIKHGSKIIYKRIHFLKQLEKWAKQIHYGITNEKEDLSIRYLTSISSNFLPEEETEIIELFKEKIKKTREQEFYRGTTLIGPHRDDITFYINKNHVASFASQGQQRTTALSLKLAEIELIHEEVGEYPILLLDDVLSELDHIRQTQLIQTIEDKVQTLITTTSTDGIDIQTLNRSSIYHVDNGIVTSQK